MSLRLCFKALFLFAMAHYDKETVYITFNKDPGAELGV